MLNAASYKKLQQISLNLCKSRNLYLIDFKIKRENYKSNSVAVIVHTYITYFIVTSPQRGFSGTMIILHYL